MSVLHKLLLATGTFVTLTILAAPAEARSCGQLWYARNSIFAAAGQCFKTPQAIGAFGKRCYPPYGELTPRQQARVDAIKTQERRQGCT
jgi:YARHG domain-containing protein